MIRALVGHWGRGWTAAAGGDDVKAVSTAGPPSCVQSRSLATWRAPGATSACVAWTWRWRACLKWRQTRSGTPFCSTGTCPRPVRRLACLLLGRELAGWRLRPNALMPGLSLSSTAGSGSHGLPSLALRMRCPLATARPAHAQASPSRRPWPRSLGPILGPSCSASSTPASPTAPPLPPGSGGPTPSRVGARGDGGGAGVVGSSTENAAVVCRTPCTPVPLPPRRPRAGGAGAAARQEP